MRRRHRERPNERRILIRPYQARRVSATCLRSARVIRGDCWWRAEANVVVWSGDPFEFSTRAEHVFVRGREYTEPTREDLLTGRYRQLPPAR